MPQQPLAQVPLDATWDWQEHGACREADTALFFHPQNERGLSRVRRDRAAKSVCARCAVRLECADYAIRAREPYGVWGGLTEEERERIYVKSALTDYGREKGAGLRAAADALTD
jgi:WhiB family redox-sensing transcriptional regulator